MRFLGQARKFLSNLGTEPARKVQYYSVACAQGHRLRGERTLGYQALRCPACGEGVFVLPLSPLPEPAAPPRSPAHRSAPRAMMDPDPVALTDPISVEIDLADARIDPSEAEIIWEDEVAAEPAAAEVEPAPPRPRGAPDAGSPPAARTAKPKPRKPAAAPGEPETEVRQRRGARATPTPAVRTIEIDPRILEARDRGRKLKLVLASVVVLVVATAAWRYRRQMHEQYPLIAERGKLEGIPALDEGHFDRANQILSAAKAAVDALGGAVDDAETIRNAADEASIFVDLAAHSLEEILTEAGRASPEEWPTRFKNLYRGSSIIIDTRISATPGDGGPNYEIEYLVLPAGEAAGFREAASGRPERIGRIDLAGFQLFELARPKAGDHVTFGARLADFRYDPAQDAWIISFEPKSGVFILRTKALEALDWPRSGAFEPTKDPKP